MTTWNPLEVRQILLLERAHQTKIVGGHGQRRIHTVHSIPFVSLRPPARKILRIIDVG